MGEDHKALELFRLASRALGGTLLVFAFIMNRQIISNENYNNQISKWADKC